MLLKRTPKLIIVHQQNKSPPTKIKETIFNKYIRDFPPKKKNFPQILRIFIKRIRILNKKLDFFNKIDMSLFMRTLHK